MNESSKPDKAEMAATLVWPFGQLDADAAHQFWDSGQAVVRTWGDLNTEVTRFVGQRLSRDGEAAARMAQCRSLPEIGALEADWLQGAIDDYAREMSKLMEVNGRLFGGLMACASQAEPKLSTAENPSRAVG